ncbi:hypothetical protein LEN26_016246 [Aphanomyces euteiches]|nr:hypothetical protein LEN26_016246 [Aphanomyces euteiches]
MTTQPISLSDGLSRIERTGDNSGYAFTALDVIDRGVESMAPIENFPHLMFVNLSKNSLSDGQALSRLEYLTTLNLSENKFTELPPLKHAFLKDVDLSNNQLTSLQNCDVGQSILSLKLNGNQLTSLDGISKFSSLIYLELARNEISQLAASGPFSTIQQLVLSENKLTALAGLELFPNVVTLAVDLNQITTFESVATLTQLQALAEVDLTGNGITELENYRFEMLSMLPRIKKLDGIVVTDEERLKAINYKQTRAPVEEE